MPHADSEDESSSVSPELSEIRELTLSNSELILYSEDSETEWIHSDVVMDGETGEMRRIAPEE